MPADLLDLLEAIAIENSTSRARTIERLLSEAIGFGDREPRSTDGAIEALRLELSEAIERIEHLERSRQRSTTIYPTGPTRAHRLEGGETLPEGVKTSREVAALEGWSMKNLSRNAENSGRWERVGKRGQLTTWRRVANSNPN